MNLKDYKNYIVFLISLLMFVVMGVYSLVIYWGWDDPVDESNVSSVEVNLPILDLQNYTTLSKQYDAAIIENSN